MMSCQNEFTFIRLAPLRMVARMNAPSSGPVDGADRAEQAGAADHRRGDRLQLPAYRPGGVADAGARGQHDADDGCAERRQDVGRRVTALTLTPDRRAASRWSRPRRDSGPIGCGAGRRRPAPRRGSPSRTGWGRPATRRARSPVNVSLVTLIGRAVGHQQADAAQRRQVASVMMKGGRPMLTMPKAWNAPMAPTTARRGSQRQAVSMARSEAITGQRRGEPAPCLDQQGDDDADEAHDGADRQVDAAGDDHEGLADAPGSRRSAPWRSRLGCCSASRSCPSARTGPANISREQPSSVRPSSREKSKRGPWLGRGRHGLGSSSSMSSCVVARLIGLRL